MTLQEAINAAIPTTQGDRFAIAYPFPDVTFVAAYWEHNKAVRVRGHRFDDNRDIVEQWDVELPCEMTVSFQPLTR